MRNSLLSMMSLVVLAGCLPKRSSSDPGAAPIELESIAISPAIATIDLGSSVVLHCTATFSDGSAETVAADWTFSMGGAIIANAAGQEQVYTPPNDGTVQVSATVSGRSAAATITVQVPADVIPPDAGPVTACDETALYSYPPAGGGAPTLLHGFGNNIGSFGFVPDAAGLNLYYMVLLEGVEDHLMQKYNLATGTVTDVVFFPAALYDRPFGLDRDSHGNLFTVCFGDNRILKIDPVAKTIAEAGSLPAGWYIDLAVGPDDAVYASYYGGMWISRTDPVTHASIEWAQQPAGAPDGWISCGLAINRRGEAFTTDVEHNILYRSKDLNGDGDAMDAGETTAFATLWTTTTSYEYFVFGVSAARGGSVLVNIMPESKSAERGLWWLKDLNGDGDCDDAGERVLYNAQETQGSLDGSCIAAPR